MTLAERHLTLEEFLRLPEDEPALEYEDGVTTQKVSPKNRHARLQSFLVQRVNFTGEPGRRYLALTESRATFGGRSYVPDVIVIRWDRIPVDPDGKMLDDFTAAPDVAVEILSPGQSHSAVFRRCLWYVENDVSVALFVDPDDETVFVFRAGAIPVPVRGPAPIQVADVLPGLRLTAQELFDSLRLA